MEREKVPERRTKELGDYVGFANLPNQVYRKAVKRGFDFTLMVVGTYHVTKRAVSRVIRNLIRTRYTITSKVKNNVCLLFSIQWQTCKAHINPISTIRSELITGVGTDSSLQINGR